MSHLWQVNSGISSSMGTPYLYPDPGPATPSSTLISANLTQRERLIIADRFVQTRAGAELCRSCLLHCCKDRHIPDTKNRATLPTRLAPGLSHPRGTISTSAHLVLKCTSTWCTFTIGFPLVGCGSTYRKQLDG